MSNLTYLVSAPIQNFDILKFHSILLKRYWSNCPYTTIAVLNIDNNTLDNYEEIVAQLDYDRIIYAGEKANAVSRLKYALQQITTDYIFLSLEDFLLYSKVNTDRINELLIHMKKREAVLFSLFPSLSHDSSFLDEDALIKAIPPYTAYRYTFQAGIWKKDFLLQLLKNYKNIWELERKAGFDEIGQENLVLKTEYTGYPYIECVRRGKWMPEGLLLLANECLYPDFTRRNAASAFDMLKFALRGFIFNSNRTLITKIINYFNIGYKVK